MKKRLLISAMLIVGLMCFPVKTQADGIVKSEKKNASTVALTYDSGKQLTIDFFGPNIFRLFLDPNGGDVRNPQASPEAQILVNNPRKDVGEIGVTEVNNELRISTAKVCLSFNKASGLLCVTDLRTNKRVLNETIFPSFEGKKTTLEYSASPDEYFYGGGVQNGRFSHKGKSIAIENTNNWVDGGVASPTPFYWSTAGYGFMWHTFKPGRYDFGAETNGVIKLSHNENYLDVFIMVDETPVALLNDFYQLTGNPVLLPKFGFYEGHLNAYNRDYWTENENGFMAYEDGKLYNESQKDNGGIKESLNGEKNNYQFSARAAIDRYLNNDMPLGWFLPNDGYGAGYGQTGSIDGNIQNLKEFGDYARSKGVEIGLWTQSDLYPKEGVEPLLQRDITKEVGTAGVRVLKTDVAWVGAGYSFGLNGIANVAEVMPREGNNARPFIISLDGWAGTQRYAGIWTGDQTGGDWEYIRYHIPTFIGSGLSGQPNITNDMDGIFGGKNIPVNVRDFQWKTFTPMELNMDGWGSNPKYPQVLGEPATTINRTYLKLKSSLMPYTYSIAHDAIDGKPIIRALFLDYPNAYTLGTKTQYEFLYGPSMLVAPIYKNTAADKEGNDVRHDIYLPEGRWVDFYNGNVYAGNCIINDYAAPLWKLPVFVKEDAIIPMTTPHNTPNEMRKDLRIYNIYAAKGTKFAEYDDDGKTQAYLSGESTTTQIETKVENDVLTITVSPTTGDFKDFVPTKQTQFVVNASSKPKKLMVTIGGKKIKLKNVANADILANTPNSWCYAADRQWHFYTTPNSGFAVHDAPMNPQIVINLDKADVRTETVVTINGFAPLTLSVYDTNTAAETLAAPNVKFTEDNVNAYDVTPTWDAVDGADYYEIRHDGQVYSTIRNTSLNFSELTPETAYDFEVRAVGKTGISPWTKAEVTTTADPLKWAVNGVTARTSFDNQGGQGVNKLFDRDEKSGWHSKWGSGEAIPGDVTIDLHSVNQLDKLVYIPRNDAGNGTILEGTYSLSTDKQTWSEPVPFTWARTGEEKVINLGGDITARYIRLHLTNAIGNFASGQEMYVFKVPNSESTLQGDINRDKRIDENDLTSYMNYTGLRRGDGDFDYVSIGDINQNGLIDAYDISVVTTQLDGGVRESNDHCSGSIILTPDKKNFKSGDDIRITVSGKDLHYVNGLSFGLPYDATELEYVGIELVGMKNMVNLTYDRLHTNGTKQLYPTFVNRGNEFLLDENSDTLFVLKFRAKKNGTFTLQPIDGMLVDRNLGTKAF